MGFKNSFMEANGGQWVRGSVIGRGSFGTVSLAFAKKASSIFPTVMAVKSAEVSVSATLQKEYEVLNNLQGSPFVIRCLGEEVTKSDNGQMIYNLLMEYASCGSLADHIDKFNAGLPEAEVRRYTSQLLKGLNHVHESGYVHCDIKPDNVLLVPSGTNFVAKIADFGLAKRERESKRTRYTGYLRGTAMYLAPEVVLDHVQEAPADIWALGCVVLEMLTGECPWDSESDFTTKGLLRRIGDSEALPHIPAWLSDDAGEFLKRCLVRNPTFRFTTEMLINQPFVSGVKEDDEEEEEDEIAENSDLLSCSRSEDPEECRALQKNLQSLAMKEKGLLTTFLLVMQTLSSPHYLKPFLLEQTLSSPHYLKPFLLV